MDHHPYDLSPCLACKQALLFDFHLAEQPLIINSYLWKTLLKPLAEGNRKFLHNPIEND